jgi:ankyrin repeat protein
LDNGTEYEREATSTAASNQSFLVLEKIKMQKSFSIKNQVQKFNLANDKSDQLIGACSSNNFEKAKILIEKDGVDVNCRDSRGARPIHKACSSANIQLVNYLIEKGAEINCIDLAGKSPLHEACISRYDRKDVVKRLLELNAKVDYLDQDKNTQIHVAIISRKFEIAEMLASHYENLNLFNIFKESPLHLAADFGPKSLLEKLIELGCEVNTKDINEKTLLHRAVTSNSIDIVDLLLSKGANTNVYDKNKETPMLIAIKRASGLPFVTSLIRHGADLNFKDTKGKTALENYMEAHV